MSVEGVASGSRTHVSVEVVGVFTEATGLLTVAVCWCGRDGCVGFKFVTGVDGAVPVGVNGGTMGDGGATLDGVRGGAIPLMAASPVDVDPVRIPFVVVLVGVDTVDPGALRLGVGLWGWWWC